MWCGLGKIDQRCPALSAVIHAARLTQGDDTAAYLTFMGIRLLEMHRVKGSKRKVGGCKRYLGESKGALIGDIWDDVSTVQRSSKERTGWKMQHHITSEVWCWDLSML